MKDLEGVGEYLEDNPLHHRQIIQNFLNMVVVETQDTLISNEDLEYLLGLYFSEEET